MTKLTDVAQGRDNNFNLIRILAAYAVLVTHSFALSTGRPSDEPLMQSLGMTLGSIAVDVFFLTSGFLVTASILTRRSALEFVVARVLRIYPGLLIMLCIVVFIAGPAFTRQGWQDYFSERQTLRYFLRCLTLFGGVDHRLPGVFENNPLPGLVNSSLWTMPYEVWMYALIASMWVVAKRSASSTRVVFRSLVVVAGAALLTAVALHRFGTLGASGGNGLRVCLMFLVGAAYQLFKDDVPIDGRIFASLLLALLLSAAHKEAFFWVYAITVAYLVFYLAYVPKGVVRRYNAVGDYSYGIYIYAFPIQQAIVALSPGISPLGLLTASTVATLLAPALSWHLLERHVLERRGACVSQARHAFQRAVGQWGRLGASDDLGGRG